MNIVARRSLRAIGLGLGVVLITWMLFAPIAAFHHIVACGVFAPVVLNAETPDLGGLHWGEYQVRFFLGRFALSVLVWACAIVVLVRRLYRKQKPGLTRGWSQ
jgi:hypothetical protein